MSFVYTEFYFIASNNVDRFAAVSFFCEMLNTVESHYYGHPWDLAQLSVILRCPLY